MKGFRFILFILALFVSTIMRGQYNPADPAEPGTYYSLTLQATPSNGGSFNLNKTTSYSEGTSVSIRAYTNTNFTFVGWELDGETYSTSSTLTYIMPARNVTLIARYKYTPSNPSEPIEPDLPVYSKLYLSASPSAGGSFNISSGNKYEVGTSVYVRAYSNSNFVFKNWTENGEVISTSASFYYTMKADNPQLVAHYEYDPSSPEEPQKPVLSHKLHLKSNPSAGGYFNNASGNQYADGTSVYLCAYSNQWYSFVNWTDENGEVVSTSSSFYYTMPGTDKTLTANYNYYYNPSDPGEPSEPADNGVNIYGMTENGIRSQQLAYPLFLENSTEVKELKVDMQFPEGFVMDTGNIRLASRAIGHETEVTALGDNTYRIYIKGDVVFSGSNGKLFEVPVTIPEDAITMHSYPVILTHGVAVGTDGALTSVPVRSGNIFVNKVSEDGLYARFSFDKLLNRVQFNNLSSDKAVRYTWDFGDGSASTDPNPMHIYETPGFYDVVLTSYGSNGEDVAQMTVLINDSLYWTIGGTLFLTSQKGNIRHFDSFETLLSTINAATVTENLTIGVQAGENYSISATEEHLAQFAAMGEQLRTKSLTIAFKTIGEGTVPVLALGSSEDAISYNLLAAWNTLGEMTTSSDVRLMLCGIAYNPSAIRGIANQIISSGDSTEEVDFTGVSDHLTFTWSLLSTPNTEYVSGFLTEGTGNIPAMAIDNLNLIDETLVYHITGKSGDMVFCEFEKTITIRPGTSSMSQSEWDLLLELRQALVACGWTTPWDMSGGREGDLSFKGVTIDRGHVVGLDLSGLSLQGEVPVCAFTFPRLATLSFADNHFTGDIGIISSIEGLSGQLQVLDLSRNAFSEISNPLPAGIASLNLRGQSTNLSMDIDVANFDVASAVSGLPSIFRYDHTAQTWSDIPRLRLTDYCPAKSVTGTKWEMTLDASGEETTVSSPSSSNVYRGQSGDTVYVSYPSAAEEVKNCYGLAKFTFRQGDVNFSGHAEANDLQAMLLYMFGEYKSQPFNFTAANLYQDGTVNVQDIICMVNLLLDTGDSPTNTAAPAKDAGAVQDGIHLYIQDGIVYMNTSEPVAAIHIASHGNIVWDFGQYGLTQSSNPHGVVAYSLNGTALPTGILKVGRLNGDATIERASASDALAQQIGVSMDHCVTGMQPITSDTGPRITYSVDGIRSPQSHKGLLIEKRNDRYVKVLKK